MLAAPGCPGAAHQEGRIHCRRQLLGDPAHAGAAAHPACRAPTPSMQLGSARARGAADVPVPDAAGRLQKWVHPRKSGPTVGTGIQAQGQTWCTRLPSGWRSGTLPSTCGLHSVRCVRLCADGRMTPVLRSHCSALHMRSLGPSCAGSCRLAARGGPAYKQPCLRAARVAERVQQPLAVDGGLAVRDGGYVQGLRVASQLHRQLLR